MISALVPLALAVVVDAQHLRAAIDPAAHAVDLVSTIDVRGPGRLELQLHRALEVESVRIDDAVVAAEARPADDGTRRLALAVPDGRATIELRGRGVFEEDVAAGERPGQIHNFAVQAHVGTDGVFLSDGSAWHPRPLDADGRPVLHRTFLTVEPLAGWSFVASGEPVHDAALEAPCWTWCAPRPMDGVALVGNRHERHGVVHETAHGPVEVVMHVPTEHATMAPMYLDAARAYLDLYVPRLGAFPFRRFSIVENFFSSGFAFPGFTVLGPRVVAMAPRSLAPGYLDHEMLHCWWGNGVYVDAAQGNWCEALASHGANYWRRVAEEGPAAGRAYRRGVLMKLSTDPAALDDGPLAAFGSADPSVPGTDRFVGYDKGAFVLFMLGEHVADEAGGGDEAVWAALRRFAEAHLGERAGWDDLQAAFEAARRDRPAGWLDDFFDAWVHRHLVPETRSGSASDPLAAFAAQYPRGTAVEARHERDAEGRHLVEIDPDFRLYRVLPPAQLVPTIAGTQGPGGVRVETRETRSEVASYLPQLDADENGENLLLIGRDAVAARADLLARSADPIVPGDGEDFTVGGRTWPGRTHAVLHTMPHPDRPGRFVTVFLAGDDAGWSRLRLIGFYARDTTIVWEGEQVVERRVFEPDRRLVVR